jgi:WhiB family redox-sensing transcriptional regulator
VTPDTTVPDEYVVLDDCPARRHNTLAAAKGPLGERCICPHASELRDAHLARRREIEYGRIPTPHTAARPKTPVIPPELLKVEGQSAKVLLAPYEHPPHACVGEDPELWFSPVPHEQARARAICAGCPMQDDCLQAAVANGWEGVWGAADEDDRRRMRGAWTKAS